MCISQPMLLCHVLLPRFFVAVRTRCRTRPSGSCISLDRPVCLGGMPKCPSDRGVSLRDLPEDLKIPPRIFRGAVEAMSA